MIRRFRYRAGLLLDRWRAWRDWTHAHDEP